MRYMGKKSLSRVLQIALAAVWYGAIGAIAVAVVLVVRAAFWGGTLPPPNSIQISGSGLSVLFRGPGLHVISRTWTLIMLGTVFLPWTLTLLYVVGQLRQVMASLVAERPFLAENAGRIRRIGIAVLVLALVRWVANFVMGAFVATQLHMLQAAQMPGTEARVNASPDMTLIFFGILILILAEVFRRGAELQDDHDLTV